MVSTVIRNVCTACRKVDFHDPCLECGGETISVSSRWRAPKRTNDRAWKRIEQGDLLWDHAAVEKTQRKARERLENMKERIKTTRRATCRKYERDED